MVADPAESAGARRSGWMAAAQQGDRAAYSALLGDCVGMIRATALRQGVRADRIDDVVQDVLLTIHRARHTYDPARPFDAWLRAIAQRRAIDSLRGRGRRDTREVHAPLAYEQHADEARPADEAIALAGASARLREAVAGLPDGQRQAVEQLGLAELSLDEAAAVTGRSKGALKVNLHRAIKALRERMGGPA